ncbi:MAG: Mur ligase family protein [Candidatus Borkfalkiaceae bacterium]|nr:Mur ligase family protein [Christensenellaceae bacterium]
MDSVFCDYKVQFKVFFVGIGGISMSALAVMLKEKGFIVSGYDKNESETTVRLEKLGIPVNRPNDLEECDIAVVSSAIADDDPIKVRLVGMKKAVVSRGWLLARLAECYPMSVGVAGTHGKTTCVCILAHILKCAGKHFTLHVGGEDSLFGNAYSSGDELFLTEVCEYKRNIAHFSPDIGVVLNIDDDHEESYGSFENIVSEFNEFLSRGRTAIVNYDDDNLNKSGAVTFSYSNTAADYYAGDIKFDGITLECAVFGHGARLFEISTAFLRPHDVYNILAATAVAGELGIAPVDIKNGINDFRGVKRRNEYLGDYCGKPVYADYAHHPKQVETAVNEYKERFGENVRILFQSHTYSRTARLMDDFVRALSPCKSVKLFETYAAREKFNEAGSYKKLGYKLKNATLCDGEEGIINAFEDDKTQVSAYVVLGAGDLYDKVKFFLKEEQRGEKTKKI